MLEKMGQYRILKYMLVFGLAIVFLAIVMVFIGTNAVAGTNFSPAIVVDATVSAGDDVIAADIDDDNDMDLVVAAYSDNSIYWYENLDGSGTFGTKQIIDSSYNSATSVFAADIDGDLDLDVLATARSDNTVAWFENLDGNGTFGPEQIIDNTLDWAKDVQAGDIDKDGNMDVVACGWGGTGFIAWYNNSNGDGSAWTPDIIDGTTISAFRIVLVDIDGDTDLDVVACDRGNNLVMWYENTDGSGTFGPALTIGTPMAPQGVFAADIDGDTDLDVISANYDDQSCEWYENTDGNGTFGPANNINDSIEAPIRVFAADLDLDGDSDVICASGSNETLLWFENLDGLGTFSEKRILNDTVENSGAVFAADIDNDGDLDVLSGLTGSVIWFRNYFGDVYNLDKDIYYGDIQSGIDDANSGNRLMIHGDYTGGFAVDGKTIIIIDSAFDTAGDVKIINGGSLTVDPTYWNQTGNVYVDALSTLTLDDTILQMNSSYNGEFGIQVNGTGTMNIQNNSIVKAMGAFPYWFTVMDAAIFSVEDSTIRDCGWNDTNPGLWVDADNAYLYNATLTNNYNGITFNSSTGSQMIECYILSSTYRGVGLIASDTLLTNVNISNADIGVGFFQGSSSWIINSTISGTTTNSLILFQDSHPTTLNTTFDKGQVLVTDPLSDLTVKWFLHVYCYDTVGTPVPNAFVNITDSPGSVIPMGQTDAGGWIQWFQVTEYMQGQTFWDSYSPYKIIAEIPAYYGSEMAKMDQSRVVNIFLGLQRVHNIEKDLWYAGIQKAVDDADAGNHIEIYNGTYNETVIVDRALTIMAAYPGNCTVDGKGVDNTFTITAEGVEITGLIIANHLDTFGIYCTAGGFYIHDNDFAVEEIGIGIDLEDIGVDMSGVASVNIGDMIIEYNDFNSGYMGILVRIQNIGYNLSDNAAVNLGAIYITDNTMTTYHGVYMERMENLGYIMSGGSSFTWGGLFVNKNTMTCSGQGIYADYFHHWGSYMEDNASFLMGDIELNNNTIDAGEEGINTVRFNYWGEYNYDLSSFQMGDVLINDNIVNATEKGIVWWDMDHHGNYMYNQSTYVQGDIEFNRNQINASNNDGLYLDDFDYWGYYLYGDTVVTIGYVHICDNVVIATGLGSDGIYLGSASDHGRRLYDNAMLYREDIHIDRNDVIAEGIGIDLDGISYWAWHNNGTSICQVGNYTVNDNTIVAGNDGIEQGNTRYNGKDMFNGSSFTMGNWEFCGNTIQASGRGIDLSGFDEWGYQMSGSCSFTMGDFLINNNTIDSTLEGINTVTFNYWGISLTGTSSFQMGDFLVNDNIVNSTERGIAWWDMYYRANYMYNQSTYVQGDIEFNRNIINATNNDGLYLDDFDYWGYFQYGNTVVTFGHVEICDNVVVAAGSNSDGIYLGSASDHGRRLFDNAVFSRKDIHIDRNDIVAEGYGIDADGISYWAWWNFGASICNVGNYTINDNTIVAGRDGIEQGNTHLNGANMYNESIFIMGSFEFCRNTIQAGWSGIDLGNFARWGYQNDGSSSVTKGDFLINDNQIIAGWSGVYLSDSCQQWGSEIYTNSSVTIGKFEVFHNTIDAGRAGINISVINLGHTVTGDSTVDVGAFRFLVNTLTGSRGIEIRNLMYFGFNISGNAMFNWGGLYVDDNIINATQNGIYLLGNPYATRYWGVWMNDSASFTMNDVSFSRNDIISGGNGINLQWIGNWGNYMNGTSSFTMGDVLFNDNVINSTTNGLNIRELAQFGVYMYGDSTYEMGDIELDRNDISTYKWNAMNLDDFDEWGRYMYGSSSYRMGNLSFDDNTFNVGWGGISGNAINHGEINRHGEYMYDSASFVMGDISMDRNTIVYSSGGGFWLDDFDEWGHHMYGNCTFIMGSLTFNDNFMNVMYNGIWHGELERHGYHMHINSSYTMGNIEFSRNVIVSSNPGGSSGFALSELEEWGKDLTGTSSYTMGHVLFEDNQVSTNGHGINLEHSVGEWGMYVYDDSHVIIGDFIFRNNTVDASRGALNFTIDRVGYNVHGDSTVTVGTFMLVENNLKGSRGIDIEEIAEFGYNNSGNSVFTWGGLYVDDNVINATQYGILQDWGYYIGYWGVWMNDSASFDMGDVSFCRNDIITDGRGIELYDIRNWGNYMNGTSSFSMGDVLFNDNTISSTDQGLSVYDLSHFGFHMDGDSTYEMGEIEFDRNDIITYSGSAMFFDDFDEWGQYMYGYSSYRMGNVSIDDNTLNAGWGGFGGSGIHHGEVDSHGEYMYDYASFVMGDISMDRNTVVNASSDGLYLDDFDHWGHYMYGNCTFVMGSLTFNDNVINAKGTGIRHGELERHGYHMYINSSYTMGNIEFCRNMITVNNSPNWAAGFALSELEEWGKDLTGTSTFTMGHFLLEDNQIWSTGHGINFEHGIGEWGKLVYDDSHVFIGDFILRNNTVDAIWGALNLTIDEVGHNVHGDSTVTVGAFMIVENILKGSRGIDIEEIAEFGYNNSGNSIFTWGGLYVDDNVINATQDGILQDLGPGPVWYYMGYWGYWLNDSASVSIGDVSFSRNTIEAEESGLKLWFFQYWGNHMYGDSSFTVGDVLFVDNDIKALNDDGLAVRELSDLGSYMHHDSEWIGGDIELSQNTIEAGDDGIWNDDFYEWGHYMYGNASFHLGSLRVDDNIINASSDGIDFANIQRHGYRMYNNSSFMMGDISFDRNTINASNFDGMNVRYLNYWGYHMWGTCTFVMGNFTVNDNVIQAGDDGVEVDDFRHHGYNMSVISSYSMGNTEFCRNIITSGSGGLRLDQFERWGNQMSDSSTFLMGDILIRDNVINCNDNGIWMVSWMERWGYDVHNSSHVTIGNFEIVNNTIDAGLGTINWTMDQIAEMVTGNSIVEIGMFRISDNNINGLYGINIRISDWLDISNNSIVNISGLEVTGNTVISGLSGFEFTTVNTPINVAPTATLNWGDVVIDGNDFDVAMYGIAIVWKDPDLTIPQPEFHIRNTNIHDGLAGSIGLMLINITSAYGEMVTIDTFDYGIFANKSAVHEMINSTLVNCAVMDISLYSDSYIFMVNSTFDNSSVFFEDFDSLLEVGWFMNVLVQSQVPLPIPGATVAVADVDGSGIFNGTTNSEGKAFYIICTEYLENITGIIKNFNDYTANATAGSNFGVAIPDPTMNQTRLVIITFIDVVPPNIFGDNSDTEGTTGDPFYFEINATDDLGIVSVHVNFRLGGVGPYTNLTMTGTGPYSLIEILPPDYVGFIEYYFTAVDSGGFWVNTTPTTAPITDNDPPIIISDNSDIIATTGDPFNFIVDVSDNIAMSVVRVLWWFGAGAPTNDTMSGTGPYTFSIPVPLDSLDQLHYYFIMNDTAGNWYTDPQVDVNVTDNDAPQHIWVSQPMAGTTGESVLVSIQATDNIDLPYYKIDIDGMLYDLVKDGDYYNYTINVPPDSDADITYSIILNDSANNPNNIPSTVIDVTDNDEPTYSWVLQPIGGTTGESVLVSIQAFDNIDVSYYKIEIDGMLYDMVKDGDFYNYTINVPTDSESDITYTIHLNDSADNPNSTLPTVITVTDNDAPTYNWVIRPTGGLEGTSVDVSLEGLDNIGIVNATITVNGTTYDLVKDGDFYNYTIDIPPGSTENFTYNATFRDAEGNEITTPDTEINVVSVDNEAPQFIWIEQPINGTTGDPVLISLLATDNVGITYFKIDIDGILYDLVKDGDYYNFTINVSPNSLANITYFVVFNDSSNNQNTSSSTIVTITDNDPPVIISDDSDTTATTGETFNFMVDTTDNLNIAEVHVVWWFGSDPQTDNNMTGTGPYDFNIPVPPDSLDTLHYYFRVVDDSGNWVIGPQVNITVTDNDEPTYIWILQPTTGSAGDSIDVSIMATDNIGITNYTINVNGTVYDMVKDGDYYNFTIDIPLNATEDFTYFVTFLDNVSNSNTTLGTTVTLVVPDFEPPMFIWVLHPMNGTTGDPVIVSLIATDNIGITYYKIEIDGMMYDLTKDGDFYNLTIDIPQNSTADITYTVYFNDTANNPNSSLAMVITVTDDDAPTYNWIIQPTDANTGDSVVVSLEAFDNIGVTSFKINIDGTEYDLTQDGDFYNYTINVPTDSTATITYNITFTDAAGNLVTTPDTIITVTAQDNEQPNLIWILHPDTGTTGDAVEISLMATDNVGITLYRIDIDGTQHDLVKDGDYYNYTFILPTDSTTDVTYFVFFNDDANNPIAAPDTIIAVTDNDTPTGLVDTSDTTATTGDTFTYEVDATDNIGIHEVHVVYWFGTGTPTNTTMTGTGPYTLDITIPSDSLDTLHYYFTITDEAGNWLVGTQVDISITDDVSATVSNEASDESGEEGEAFTFQIDASDNVGISEVRVAYWFGDDESQKQFITLIATDGTYSGSFTPEQSGTMNYYFEVTDDGGNTLESDDYTVDVAAKAKEEEGVNPIFFILPIIVIIILLLLFLLMRKKKEEEVSPEVAEGEEELLDEELLEGEELEEGLEPEEEFEEGVEEEPSEEFEAEEDQGEEPEWEEAEEEGGEEFQVEEEPSEESELEEETGEEPVSDEGEEKVDFEEEPAEESEPGDTEDEKPGEGEPEEKKSDELDDILNGL